MSSQWGRIPLEWQDQHREATWGTFQRPGFVKQIRILPSIPKELCCTRSRSPRVARGEIVDAVDGPASFNVDSNDATRWRAPLGHCGAVAAVYSPDGPCSSNEQFGQFGNVLTTMSSQPASFTTNTTPPGPRGWCCCAFAATGRKGTPRSTSVTWGQHHPQRYGPSPA